MAMAVQKTIEFYGGKECWDLGLSRVPQRQRASLEYGSSLATSRRDTGLPECEILFRHGTHSWTLYMYCYMHSGLFCAGNGRFRGLTSESIYIHCTKKELLAALKCTKDVSLPNFFQGGAMRVPYVGSG